MSTKSIQIEPAHSVGQTGGYKWDITTNQYWWWVTAQVPQYVFQGVMIRTDKLLCDKYKIY